ncbi:uncharacterized protein BO80DRAFT_207808 [Aspergillus ibericus CBS 121593]|uniref:Uncharacterized protein n=1 Tax=Aspergillus ibericus CBS 121593 TaxID=1448316 RepID=A0A395HA03_9EURO|nr:hypothetical protein BO80DRAFT_207808 [Aspergillus ibericus CBS 121593]RAL04747.1 hypothetical protein BO80DRAFT_207808 [Aspergillus ibericus CBS 121593]
MITFNSYWKSLNAGVFRTRVNEEQREGRLMRGRIERRKRSTADEQRIGRLRGIAAQFADPIIVPVCIRGRSGPGPRNPSRQDGAELADGRVPAKFAS